MFGGLMRSGQMRQAMINALKIRQEKPAATPAPKKKKPAGTVPAAARTKAQVEQEKKKRFCEFYINDLQNRSKSRSQIIEKLKIRGISCDLISHCMTRYFDSTKEDLALKMMITKAERRFAKLPSREKREKMLNYLTRKGFSYWQVKEIINEE